MFFEKRYARAWIGAGLIIILAGVIFEVLLSTNAANLAEATGWPTVIGTVRSAEVRPSSSSAENPSTRLLHVSYLYKVGGESFAGSQEISLGLNSADPGSKYGSGQSIVVYYNPNAPVQSLIDPKAMEPIVNNQNMLVGPKNVLLGSAMIASLPFIGIGIGLLVTGKNAPVSRRTKRTYRGRN